MKPVLFDLCCGAGGATKGYQDAGFYVIGVDINPQPHYIGDEFYQADALAVDLAGAAAVHASPPCQFATTMSNKVRGKGDPLNGHLNLIPPMRSKLLATALPYVIENVPGARRWLKPSVALHGGMFGLGVQRPRLFECNFPLDRPPLASKVENPVGVYGKHHDGRLLWKRADGSEQRAAHSLVQAQLAMGMDWGDWHGVKEAIPPAYSRWIGTQLMSHLAGEPWLGTGDRLC
jgi:hypothetical protein